MTRTCLILLSLAAFSAGAQPVYKCTTPEGAVTYQSVVCAAGDTSASRKHASSAMSLGGGQTVTEVPAGPGQRRVQVRYTTNAANEACDGARAMRTAALGAAGAHADADLRSRLDRDVQNACR